MAQYSVSGRGAVYDKTGAMAVHDVSGSMARYNVTGIWTAYDLGLVFPEDEFGFAQFVGIGSLAESGFKNAFIDGAISAAGNTVLDGAKEAVFYGSVDGVGSLDTSGTGAHTGAGPVIGVGGPSASGTKNAFIDAILTGVGSLTAFGSQLQVEEGDGTIVGVGSNAVSAFKTAFVSAQSIGIGSSASAGTKLRKAEGVNFDGTNDYLTRGAGLTGASDGKIFSFSVWLRSNGDGSLMRMWAGQDGAGSTRFSLLKQTTNLMRITANNSSDTLIMRINETGGLTAADGWVHWMGSFDLSDGAKSHLYRNDTSVISVDTYTNDNIDFTTSDFGVGRRPFNADQYWNGDIAEFWLAIGTYIDLSVEANRRKFISSAGKPVDLGASGELPTGSSPIVFLSGATASWHTNKGTGGGFTENGALTDASSSPSD